MGGNRGSVTAGCPSAQRHTNTVLPKRCDTPCLAQGRPKLRNICITVRCRSPDGQRHRTVMQESGTKQEPKPKLLSPDIFWWGGGLPREGAGAKKSGMSLETQGIKLFWRDIPGFCQDIPEAPEKFEKKMFGFNFWPLKKRSETVPPHQRPPHQKNPEKMGRQSNKGRHWRGDFFRRVLCKGTIGHFMTTLLRRLPQRSTQTTTSATSTRIWWIVFPKDQASHLGG